MAEIISEVQETTGTKRTVDYGKGIGWFLSDPKFWSTALKASLLFLSCIFIFPIIYVGPVITGFSIQLIRNIQGGKYELPELGDSDQWQQGIIFCLILIALGIISTILQVVMVLPFSEFIIESELAETVGPIVSGFTELFVGVLVSFLTYAMYAIYAKTLDVGAMFSIDNLRYVLSKNAVSIIISMLVIFGASLMFGFIGILAFCIGILPAMFAINIVQASLIGQFDVEGVA